MNINKCEALKTLGFNYIVRDMDGRLVAWMNKPVRMINCLEEAMGQVKEAYDDSTDIQSDIFNEGEENEWSNGIHINMSSFQCSPEDDRDTQMYSYGHFELKENNGEFREITWKNSPYII